MTPPGRYFCCAWAIALLSVAMVTPSVGAQRNNANEAPAAITLSPDLTPSEIEAFTEQLARCWSFPALSRDVRIPAVDLEVTVNPDRTVATAHVTDQERIASDPAYAAAAKAALHATQAPQCKPLELPLDKYEVWKSMTIHLDPKEMLGR